MRHSKSYNFRLPERVEGRNDPADIDDLTFDIEGIDGVLKAQADEDARLARDKADLSAFNNHKVAAVLDHPDKSVTDAKLGERTVLDSAGLLQALLTAIGNAIRAIAGTARWNDPPATTLAAAKAHEQSRANPHAVTKAQVGLGVADNTADRDKPVSTAQQVALDGKLDSTGGRLSGFLTLHATPTEAMHAATKKYIDDQMGAAGSGDMMKAVYDSDDNGVVSRADTAGRADTAARADSAGRADTAGRATSADAVAWAGVTGKPGSFTPVAHIHTRGQITDFPASLPANGGNADMVDGSHAWQMQTLNSSGNTHGPASWLLQCRHNFTSDGSFRLFAGNASIPTSVNSADSAKNADTVDGFHIAGAGTSAPGSLAHNALFFVYE